MKYYDRKSFPPLDIGWAEISVGDIDRYEGKWGYVEEMRDVKLLDGVTTRKDGAKYGGKRKYYPQIKRMYLERGWFESPSGDCRAEGEWGWSPENKKVEVSWDASRIAQKKFIKHT